MCSLLHAWPRLKPPFWPNFAERPSGGEQIRIALRSTGLGHLRTASPHLQRRIGSGLGED